jgi:hypothetical protein
MGFAAGNQHWNVATHSAILGAIFEQQSCIWRFTCQAKWAMRQFFQSCTTLAFSLSLLSVELVDQFTSNERGRFKATAARAVDAVSNAAVDQLGPRLRSTFRGLNDIQREFVGIMFDLSVEFAKNGLNRLTDESEADRPAERYWVDARIHSESAGPVSGNHPAGAPADPPPVGK